MPLLIFDCDGTLVDSELIASSALASELASIGVFESGELIAQNYRGEKLANVLNDLSKKHDVLLPSDFVEKYRLEVSRLFDTELRPISGADDALRELEYPKCVASSGPRHKIEQSLSLTGLRIYFEKSIFSSYDIEVWKPHPGLFLHAATEMGFGVSDCIVIEDSALGIEAARRAGMTCILYDPQETVGYIGENVKIRDMRELVPVIRNLALNIGAEGL